MESNRLAIIIPAYNEQSTIGKVIDEIFRVLGDHVYVVVVNDCSKDGTCGVALSAGAIVVDLETNLGYAGAIEKGLNYAIEHLEVDYLLTMDADGQHDPYSIDSMLQKASEGNYDLVVGQRPCNARFSEYLYAQYFKFKFNVADPLSGLKLYKASLYRQFGFFESYDSIGTEILASALTDGKRIAQVPISIRDRQDSSPRFGNFWKANLRILSSLYHTVKKY